MQLLERPIKTVRKERLNTVVDHLKIAREKDIPCGIRMSEADEDLVAEGLRTGVISHGAGLSDFIQLELIVHVDAIHLGARTICVR